MRKMYFFLTCCVVWASLTTHAQTCNAVTSFPFVENFDSGISPCWTQQQISGNKNWTAVTVTGAIVPQSGTKMAEFRSAAIGDRTRLISPRLDLTGLNSPKLKFYVANSNFNQSGFANPDEVKIYYKTSAGGIMWELDWVYNPHTFWLPKEINLPNKSNDYYIIFEAKSVGGVGLNIDNVRILDCVSPTNVSVSAVATTGATVSFTPPATSPSAYEVSYSTAGSTPVTTTVTSSSYNITGLISGATYDVKVRSVCTPDDYSTWSAETTFTTPCTSLPWTEGFEGLSTAAVNIFPGCWTKTFITGANVNSAGTSALPDTFAAGPRTGSKYMYTKWNSTNWIYTPGFQLTAGVSYDFSFYMMNKRGWAGFTMDVKYGTSATEAGMTTALLSGYAANNMSYDQFKYTITPSVSGTYYFGIKSTSPDNAPWYLSFDDFKMEVSPCQPKSLPWTEGFEGLSTAAVNIFPDCWKKTYIAGANVNSAGTAALPDTFAAGPLTGSKYMYTKWNSTNWMFTPGFYLTAGVSYDFSFYMMNKRGWAGFTMDVKYGTSANAAGMTNALLSGYAANNMSYDQFKYTITPSSTGVYYFGIKSTSPDNAPWYLSFDDFKMEVKENAGKTTVAGIKPKINLKPETTGIIISNVYPNPVTKQLNMIITSPVAEKVTIVVTDLQGRILMQQRTQLATGENQSRFNVQSLAAGTYLIKAVCANGCETAVQRFVKQ